MWTLVAIVPWKAQNRTRESGRSEAEERRRSGPCWTMGPHPALMPQSVASWYALKPVRKLGHPPDGSRRLALRRDGELSGRACR